jgi:hypothetical protein
MKQFNLTRRLWPVAALLLFLASCRKEDQNINTKEKTAAEETAAVANDWFKLTYDLTKQTPGFTPPVAARAYGYTAVAMYEAVVQGSSQYNSLQGRIAGLQAGAIPQKENRTYSWPVVANYALSTIVRRLYINAPAAGKTNIDYTENKFYNLYLSVAPADVVEASKLLGIAVGNAVYDYSKSDGQEFCYSSNFPASYIPPVGAGLWISTLPAFQSALQPYWGNVRTFMPQSTSGIVISPMPFSATAGSPCYNEFNEVVTVKNNLSTAQRTVGQYWSDDPGLTGTPPGHTVSIARQVCENENLDLMRAAEVYVKTAMSVHDAFVCCWKLKYIHNTIRPVSYIRQNIDGAFTPLLNTPPFPEYPSGHSVQSGAGFQVLTDLFGAAYRFTDNTHSARTDIDGSPRSFNSFFEAADEAAISRLYGGIHPRQGIVDGVTQGKIIGKLFSNLNLRK